MVAPNESTPTEDKGIDFRDRDLRGRDFSNESLRNADFSGADLRNCKFQNTDLTGANFTSVQVGVDVAAAYDVLWEGSLGATILLFVALLFLISILTESDWLSGLSSYSGSSSSDTTEKLDKQVQVHKTLVPVLLFLFVVTLVAAGLGGYCLEFKNVNPDSLLPVEVWTGGFLSLAPVMLGAAIIMAGNIVRTDFSHAEMTSAQIDRIAFQNAKSTGAEIEKVNWL